MTDLNTINLEITASGESAQAAVQSTAQALQGLKAISAGLSGIKFSKSNLSGITAISNAMKGIASASTALQQTGGAQFQALNNFSTAVSQLSAACKQLTAQDISRLNAVASAMNAIASSTGGNSQNVAQSVRDVIGAASRQSGNRGQSGGGEPGALKTVGRGIASFAKNTIGFINKVRKSFGLGSASAGDFIRSLARIAKYRMLRTILSAITKGASEGLQNLARASAEANATLSQLSGGALTLKNSLGGALYSVLASIVGVLSSIISAAVSAINWINMLFAILGGRATFKKATSSAKEYGSALGGAAGGAKALKQELMGFDEINALTPDGGGGGGGGGAGGLDYGGMFEETPIDESLAQMVESADFTLLGVKLADKVNSALGKIDWSKIQSGAGRLAMAFATFINGAVFQLDADVVGRSLAGVVNTALEFINTFTYTVDWKGLGNKLKQFITRAIKDIEPKQLGAALVAKIKIVLDTLAGLLPDSKSEWDEITGWVAEVLESAVEKIDKDTLAGVIKSVLEGALSAVTNIANSGVISNLTSVILTAITDALGGIEGKDIAEAIKALLKDTLLTVGAVLQFAIDVVEVLVEWIFPGNFGKSLSDALSYRYFRKDVNDQPQATEIDYASTTKRLDLAKARGVSANESDVFAATQMWADVLLDASDAAEAIDSLFATVAIGTTEEASIAMTALSQLGVIATDANGNFIPIVDKLREFGAVVNGITGEDVNGTLSEVAEGIGSVESAAGSASETVGELANSISEASGTGVDSSISDIDSSALDSANTAASTLGDTMRATGEDAEHLYTKIIEIPSDIVYNLSLNNYDQVMTDLDDLKSAISDAGQLGIFGFKLAFNGIGTWITDNVVTPITDAFSGINLYSAGKRIMSSLKVGLKSISMPKFKVTWSSNSNTANILGKSYTISIPTPTISLYAKGGFPSAGELFMANEAGAEMVGRIGNKPAVANQEQIGDAIFKYMDAHQQSNGLDTTALAGAIVGALKSAGIGAVYLDGKMLSSSINRESRRSGKPAINF